MVLEEICSCMRHSDGPARSHGMEETSHVAGGMGRILTSR